ncbi:MAG: S41 family peptidase, partial [Planctomycetota bacterium]|nr:S41 family peptidase [Planctomycetota bacterium]
GPFLARRAMPAEEETLAAVHRTLNEHAVLAGEPEELARDGARGMISGLDDPYARFIGPDELAGFRLESTGTYVGIGAMLHPDGRILFPIVGGPAEAAGLLPGDRVLSINGADTSTMNSDALAALLRGPRGSSVLLELERQDSTRTSTEIRRRPVPAGTVGDARWLDRSLGIAHVHLRSFAESTPRELDQALETLIAEAPLRGLALDLRFNTGGQLESAVAIASRFLHGELVCTLRDRSGQQQTRTANLALSRWPELPLVLLINESSASGSEVLAGALRDHGAAVLIGTRSYGKGIYQEVYDFGEGGFVMKFTAGMYFTPSGRALEGHLHPELAPGGLEPDVPVALDEAAAAAIHRWHNVNRPDPRWREQVEAAFPSYFPTEPPADAVEAAALELLSAAIQEA